MNETVSLIFERTTEDRAAETIPLPEPVEDLYGV